MSSDLKRLAALLLGFGHLLGLSLGLSLGLLTVTTTSASAAPSPTPGERIAASLHTSPVYVDPSYAASAVPPARQKELIAQIRKTGLPIKVVLVPLDKGDSFGGEPDTLAAVVRDRLTEQRTENRGDDRDLILITTEDRNDDIRGFEWPGDEHQAEDAVGAVGLMDAFDDAGLAELTSGAIDLIERGDGTKAYEKASKELDKDLSDHANDTDNTDDTNDTNDATKPAGGAAGSGIEASDEAGAPSWWGIAGLAVAAAALLSGTALLVRSARHRHRPPGHPAALFAFPHAVFAAAREADEDELRRRAEAEVLALGEALRAADTEAAPGLQPLQRALDAYAAAGTVLDSARGLPDLAGVLALVTEGRDALDGTQDPLPLCFFNPLHGRAARAITWRPLGRRDQLRICACAACARAVRERRAPEVLTDATEPGGSPLPYFEVDATVSIWAATGYGSLIGTGTGTSTATGTEDGLARRVARGDFSRERRG
ncbi:hypothetical protein ABZ953_33675 [Streptomyces sp. NPDC046465]|uniref:hypothetical protein n=1 Tax=Streptomyces sp. NPDC046465 TaxID=3155810 RepID=UPI00340D1851